MLLTESNFFNNSESRIKYSLTLFQIMNYYKFIIILVTYTFSFCQNQPKDFAITMKGDTIYGNSITRIVWFGKMGWLKIKNDGEISRELTYDKVYQLHDFNRKREKTIYEHIHLEKDKPNGIELMRVETKTGPIKLYYRDYYWNFDTAVLFSDFFNGILHKRKSRKHVLVELKKCEPLSNKFKDVKRIKENDEDKITKLVQYYNEHCRPQ